MSGTGAATTPANMIGGETRALSGDGITSRNPARPERVVWSGSPTLEDVNDAVQAARSALPAWRAVPLDKRVEALRAYQSLVGERSDQFAELICAETGKALWESKGEASILGGKVDITLAEGAGSGMSRVAGFETPITESRRGVCRFRGHGVMAVVGPFNFPAHLPNGHIVPALAMGNTIVFKPSDKTPAVGQLLGETFIEALDSVGAPPGVVNVVQGGAREASSLVTADGVDGILFTGSWPVGRRILEANLDHPGRIVALELGGNNPSVVLDDAHLKQAVLECARASFATTGQRCTCTRRIIVQRGVADRFIAALARTAAELVIGDPMSDVFMGPLISADARDAALSFATRLESAGGEVALAPRALSPAGCPDGHFISPGVVRVDEFRVTDDTSDAGCDIEVFGPVVRVSVVETVDEAIAQANATRYGLAASIFTASEQSASRFLHEANAGCVNVNTGTAGASGKLPFGGLGFSGNHRPAGSFSLDYCAYPVASLLETSDGATPSPGMRFDDAWLT